MVLVERTEGKRLLTRHRHRWENILKWIFKLWDGLVWIGFFMLRICACECGKNL
jgi:hypothetical protein